MSEGPTGTYSLYQLLVKQSFEAALGAVKRGCLVSREGWNGKGLLVELQMPDAHSKMTMPYLFLTYPADGPYRPGASVPWLASQTDLLAEDWVVWQRVWEGVPQ